MLIVAPQIISILSHVTVLLFAILVPIWSTWTIRRVRKASASSPFEFFPPIFADHKPVRRASEKTIRTLATSPICKRSLSQGSIFNIEIQSDPRVGVSTRAQVLPFRQYRSYSVSPSCASEQESEKSEQTGYSWNGSESEFGRWLIGNEECNSPTGSLLDELDESAWLPSPSNSAKRRKRTGRRIITSLGIVRGIVPIPVVLLYSDYGTSGFAKALLFNYDLLLLDSLIALILAIAPLLLCIWRLKWRLPQSWEHHVYFTSLILVVLPTVTGLQLPDKGVLSIFRMTAAGLSVVTALIARDQALALYWAPLQQRGAKSITCLY